jgi:hypothetical protein
MDKIKNDLVIEILFICFGFIRRFLLLTTKLITKIPKDILRLMENLNKHIIILIVLIVT